MITRFPRKGIYYYKAGKLLHSLAAGRALNETYTIEEKEKKEAAGEPLYREPKIVNSYFGVMIELPGTNEQVFTAGWIHTPYSEEGIAFLKKAGSLLAENGERADINDRLGDFFTWLGIPDSAAEHYKVAVDIIPANAGIREKMVLSYDAAYLFQNGMGQLDSLFNRKEINFPMQLLFAKYKIHSGLFKEAQALLDAAEKIHPYQIAEIYDLNGRLQLLSSHSKGALASYSKLLLLNGKDSMVLYNIARLYAKEGNKKEAKKWLDQAVKNGFNYSYVINFDPYLDVFGKTGSRTDLFPGIRWKKYISRYKQ
jgi:tetratricopeptide (TPR) repeat protein